jgi:long-subunit fatty acid transport protein
MTRNIAAAALLAGTSTGALAAGLDRSGQPMDILFVEGNYVELSFAHTSPSVSGEGTGVPASPALLPFLSPNTSYDGVAGDFNTVQLGVKYDFTDQFSGALFFDQPFGAKIHWDGDPDRTELGGTMAEANSDNLSILLRYKFDENWSVHGGLRIDRADGEISLGGLAYGAPSTLPLPPGAPVFAAGYNGYKVELEQRTDIGWSIGGAYEIPEIALRVAVTYNGAITHDFDTTESFRGTEIGESTTEVEIPRSVNIDFQTGIAEDTLLFGAFRWVEWSEFRIEPELFTAASGTGLVKQEDESTYTLGLARQFTSEFAGQVSVSYEDGFSTDLVSPLTPTNGLFAVSLGGAYDVTDQVRLSAGARYTWLGDAEAETGTPDTARAEMRDNSAVTVGFGIGYSF